MSILQNSPCLTSSPQPAGLYIHIPFCLRKCPYCDFYSITDLSLQPAFFDALASEMNMTRKLDKVFDTLYIGGGTPSVLNIKIIDNIIKTAHQCFNILSDAEITIEVNPGTVTIEQLKGYRQAGVNRINMGVQSFNSANLNFIERIHSVREAQMAIRWAQKAGYEVREVPMARYDLYVADEVFLTGTAAEIISVVDVDKRVIGDGKPA